MRWFPGLGFPLMMTALSMQELPEAGPGEAAAAAATALIVAGFVVAAAAVAEVVPVIVVQQQNIAGYSLIRTACGR